MGLAMRATGKITKHMVRESFGMWMEMYLKVNGKKIRLMGTEFILI